MSESARLSDSTITPKRFQTLRAVSPGVPYYLAAVDLPGLMPRLEDLGLFADRPVTKITDIARVRPAWVRTSAGTCAVSRKTAASLVVHMGDASFSLGLLTNGQSGIVSVVLTDREPSCHFHRNGGILAPGRPVEMIRALPQVRLTVQGRDDRARTVSMHEATHVWGVSGVRRAQLATVFLGETFRIESFSSDKVKARFMTWGMGTDANLKLNCITPVDSEDAYMQIEGPSRKLLLPYAYAEHIYVRACNICWSCGACMTSGA